jgi:predicted ribonuclease YlaK
VKGLPRVASAATFAESYRGHLPCGPRITSSTGFGPLGIGETVHLVIPMVVVDQLDSLKRSTQKVKSRARQTGKRLEALLPKPADRVVMRAADGCETTLEVLIDALDHRRLPDSESEIVNRALYLSRLAGKPVRIATWDNLMRFRAGAVDIETIRPPEEAEIQS